MAAMVSGVQAMAASFPETSAESGLPAKVKFGEFVVKWILTRNVRRRRNADGPSVDITTCGKPCGKCGEPLRQRAPAGDLPLRLGMQNAAKRMAGGGKLHGRTADPLSRDAGTPPRLRARRRDSPRCGGAQARRFRMARAAWTPEAPAWARPRVTPAPSPAAKKPGMAVSSSSVSWSRAE